MYIWKKIREECQNQDDNSYGIIILFMKTLPGFILTKDHTLCMIQVCQILNRGVHVLSTVVQKGDFHQVSFQLWCCGHSKICTCLVSLCCTTSEEIEWCPILKWCPMLKTYHICSVKTYWSSSKNQTASTRLQCCQAAESFPAPLKAQNREVGCSF